MIRIWIFQGMLFYADVIIFFCNIIGIYKKNLRRCLDPLIVGGDGVEVIVVDDGFTDKAGEIAVDTQDFVLERVSVYE